MTEKEKNKLRYAKLRADPVLWAATKQRLKEYKRHKRATDPEWKSRDNETVKKGYRNNERLLLERRERFKAWYKANPEHNKARTKKYREVNQHKRTALQTKRSKKIDRATPSWINKIDRETMLSMYHVAQIYKVLTKILHHVDHIVPIQGKEVCGLNVPWNLQVLPNTLNIAKGNKLIGAGFALATTI